ncbi:MAG: TIGR03560 family F420-dependent LLM class oxidoreductase [Microbacteriaceae bacterium]|nr:TIGR03560 family F420-dependent LLM class oxidoreductase [Microbacteriaceae bacterium]
MKFGMFVPQGWRHDLVDIDPAEQWSVMSGITAHAENGPWESIWVYDHFHTVPIATDQATHEAWTLMSAFAATTQRVRLGQMCTCIGYRNPAYLAKVAATVDVISGGRVEMGIGAGWYEHEWRSYGYGYPSDGERLAQLDEGVQIMQRAWKTGSATLHGKHFDVEGAIVRPLPLQAGGIPVWIAGGGEKVTLRIAAKYADYTNFTASNVDVFTHKSELLRAHCAEVGTNFERIVRNSNFMTVIGDTEADVHKRLAVVKARVEPFLGAAQAAQYMRDYDGSPAVGTPEQVVERLNELKAVGLGYAIHYFPEAAYDLSGVELFEREVIPALA